MFQRGLERQGGRFYPRPDGDRSRVGRGVSSVVARLANGMVVKSEKMLVAWASTECRGTESGGRGPVVE